ncbi:hypothetical protein [uncultured Paraglaciecola sp.]|uniref:hypothetical protein n=1 Tax=uncultured Paraglaciecola sp. TaxID=1765024 RepID=UPI0026290E3A|nr:hypothetical protein [uncultured Paraglaciecola sp.]
MDINQAVEKLSESEGVKLKSSSQEAVESFQREEEWFVLVTTTYEDGKSDKMELKMPRFAALYTMQKFAPIDGADIVLDTVDSENDTTG